MPSAGLTLEELLREQEEETAILATSGAQNRRKRKLAVARSKDIERAADGVEGEETGKGKGKKKLKKAHKNAPAVMHSNRPVSRYREVVSSEAQPARDPRFSEISGKLNPDIFLKSYEFLDQYQEDEVKKMSKTVKKVKNEDAQAELSTELQRKKQEMAERRRDMKMRERMRALKTEEKEKVKAGKNPFFLKKSAIKDIALEQRYDELKSSGKLNSFLAKKRQKNANKDHLMLPRERR